MKYETIAIVAAIALAVALVLLYVLGNQFVPALNKFLGLESV